MGGRSLVRFAALIAVVYGRVADGDTERVPQGFRPPLQQRHAGPQPHLQHLHTDSLSPPGPKQQLLQPISQDSYGPSDRYRAQHQLRNPVDKKLHLKEEQPDEEKEEPDRLTLLLPQSKFNCDGKRTGYYADDGLDCEVFHYCQDNARHSWICPEGFVFHQVHLICMPPSNDNICTQSSKFHFVNDYLYKPINSDEASRKGNVTLRYSERYYPDNFYVDDDLPDVSSREEHIQITATLRPGHSRQPLLRQQYQTPIESQVFHSPEEVNIPLHHRRPIAHSLNPSPYHSQSREEYY